MSASEAFAYDYAQIWGSGGGFYCLGFGGGLVGGGCYGDGDLYAFFGVATPSDLPVDLTAGTSADVESYLSGISGAVNNVGGVSLGNDWSVSSTALVYGPPGASYTYGVNLSQIGRDINAGLSNAGRELSDGLYHMVSPQQELQPQP